ncbi:hypothetical protein K491DRAFT_709197 [Lophiostoma macrostomum CBS 122681]|uniref:Uncharacterized protein n=1 Tax=Lophiostoma macrostomum CBS 122681 TaxID=1314788 RepID=A0A6A6SJ78_9PLEO|nr:hypothetical protein K491DRAFT_709197 [Lophiostoma macrostomum CBS 122681]
MPAAAGGSGSGDPDMVLIGELLEDISRNPPAIQARKLLTEHYIAIGWLDAATENALELKKLAPTDPDVTQFIVILSKKSEPPPAPPTPIIKKKPVATVRQLKARKNPQAPVQLSGNLDASRQELTQGYDKLRQKAKFLLVDLLHLQALQKKNGLQTSKNTPRIQAIVEGRTTSVVQAGPANARSVASQMQENPERAVEIAITDLEAILSRLEDSEEDVKRSHLVKRMRAVEVALPEDKKSSPEIAFMHVEHENLDRNYVNDETMLGDAVKDIERENFWVTEDNYAWDMEELAQAITVNGGVMRNPLSRQMFTPKDIRGIVSHTHGKGLAALQVAQHEMSKGVRDGTIVEMEKLAALLLDDQSADSLPSRHAVDEFLAYVATLPELEQKALDGLRCPAKDTHTGQAYDFTIGESVRDAKGNRVCFHKTGDFIQQAAAYLRQNRGAAPDSADKCIVM